MQMFVCVHCDHMSSLTLLSGDEVLWVPMKTYIKQDWFTDCVGENNQPCSAQPISATAMNIITNSNTLQVIFKNTKMYIIYPPKGLFIN